MFLKKSISNVLLFFSVLSAMFDVFSDITYALTVPFYNKGLYWIALTFLGFLFLTIILPTAYQIFNGCYKIFSLN
jgi:hypothetical protein